MVAPRPESVDGGSWLSLSRIIATAASVACLAASGCGGDDDASESSTGPAATSQPASAPKAIGLAALLDGSSLGSIDEAQGRAPKQRTDAQEFAAADNWVYNVSPGDIYALGARLKKQGFVAGAARYFGEDPAAQAQNPAAQNGYVSAIQFRDAAAAKAEGEMQFEAAFAPCPGGECAVKSTMFEVGGIPNSNGASVTRDVRGERRREFAVVFTKGSVAAQVWASSNRADGGLKADVVTAAEELYGAIPEAS